MGWEIVRSFHAGIEEGRGGEKDYCQLVIEGIGVLTRERFDFGEEGAGTMRMERKKKTRKRNYRRSVNNNVGYRATDATRKRVSSAAANRLLYGRGL